MQKTVSIFGLGGAGIRLAHAASKIEHPDSIAFAKPVFYYQDASTATSDRLLTDKDNLFLYSTEGAGGIRKDIAPSVIAKKAQALAKQEPSDYNIIIHSLSGGSGSTIGPILAGEIAAAGKRVVSVVVSNDTSQNALANSKSTVQSYDGVAQAKNTPLLLRIHTGCAEDNDHSVLNDISWLLCLFSGTHRGLDQNDIKSFMTKGSPTTPMTNRGWQLTISKGQILSNSLAVIGLAVDETVVPSGGHIGFLKTGVPDKSIIGDNSNQMLINEKNSIWFSINGGTSAVIDKQAQEAQEAAKAIASTFDTSTIATGNDSGLVF